MLSDVKQLLDSHWQWLRDKTALREIDGQWVEITTPYLDRHNDMLQIYVRRIPGGYELTDDGYIISDLNLSGCKLDSPKRQTLLSATLAGFGVQNNGSKLEVHCTEDNFALKKHSLVQAMLSVNDLFYLAVPLVTSLFYEDVQNWLESSDIRFTPNVKFTGKSGFDHLFEFVIPKSRKEPERILQTINRPNKDSTSSIVFKWEDTKEVRTAGSRAYAILNDQEHSVSQEILDALSRYDIRAIPWSLKDSVQNELAA